MMTHPVTAGVSPAIPNASADTAATTGPISIQDIAVVLMCSDGKQRAVQFRERERSKMLGYLKQLQGTLRLMSPPMIVLELAIVAELTRLAYQKPENARQRVARNIRSLAASALQSLRHGGLHVLHRASNNTASASVDKFSNGPRAVRSPLRKEDADLAIREEGGGVIQSVAQSPNSAESGLTRKRPSPQFGLLSAPVNFVQTIWFAIGAQALAIFRHGTGSTPLRFNRQSEIKNLKSPEALW